MAETETTPNPSLDPETEKIIAVILQDIKSSGPIFQTLLAKGFVTVPNFTGRNLYEDHEKWLRRINEDPALALETEADRISRLIIRDLYRCGPIWVALNHTLFGKRSSP